MERYLKLWGKFHKKYEKFYTFSEQYSERLKQSDWMIVGIWLKN